MFTRLAFFAAFASLSTACMSPALPAPVAPTPTPASTPDSFEAPRAESPPLPSLEVCDLDAPCSQDIMVASTMSYLGKTAAEFDGVSMVQVDHDPELLLEEAFADPGFCALVAEADVEPRDGVLSASEAARVEAAVLASLEAAG